MTKKESAEYVLKKGTCEYIACTDCFIPRGFSPTQHPLCKYIISSIIDPGIAHNDFKAKVIAGKYLADINKEETHE